MMTSHLLPSLGVVALLGLTATDPGFAQDRRLAHSVPGMDEVRLIENQSYRDLTGSPDTVMYGAALLYDVFMPTGGDAVRPGVIFIHGGLVAGSTQRISPKDALPAYARWGRLVAASGLVGITFSHRLNTNENIDTAASDVLRLVAEVRQRAAEWRLDPDRICVAVFSAGGPLASLFMTDGASAAPSARCIAFYYAFMDVEHAAVISPFRPAYTEPRLSELRSYSPLAALIRNSGQLPPLLVARAGLDAIPGINASIDRFMLTTLLTNQAVEFYNHPSGTHGFDLTVEDDERAEYILAATLRFFREHLTG
jgi:acetyl esterase/lipase